MAGHSKWSNIKRKKEKTDAARAKIFIKIGREIAVAIKEGGGSDPSPNSRLRDVINKAKSLNVPNDNIDRIIKKSEDDKLNYETVIYEGYAPEGVAVIVESLTENRNRTASNIRYYFDKYGGNLGRTGCVAFMFEPKGTIVVDMKSREEDELLIASLELGAEDVEYDAEDSIAEIHTAVKDFQSVKEGLEEDGYELISAGIEQIPNRKVTVNETENIKMIAEFLEKLDEDDDVQEYWHNMENEEDLYD